MIPLNTTTITVARVPNDDTRDGYDPAPAPTTVATAVRAVIGAPTGSQRLVGGDRTVLTFTLTSDPADIQPGDTVTDDTTGQEYRVEWAHLNPGLGLDHIEGALEQVGGAT